MSEIFVCGDWHLGHSRLIELCYRPADFCERILANFDASMRPGDVLLNLGDVYPPGEEMAATILRRAQALSVSCVLVRGNHDPRKLQRCLKMGWSWVCDKTSLECYGKTVLFTHAPEATFDEDLNVHGQYLPENSHRGDLIKDGKHILISMELLKYRPIPLSTLMALGTTPAYVAGRFVRNGTEEPDVERDHLSVRDAETPQEAS